MRKWLILLFALSAAPASSAPAWTWVDADGQVHFSDRPVPGARQVEIAGAQPFGQAAPAPSASASRRNAAGSASTAAPYQSIDIVSPSDQETLWNTGSILNVQVRFRPALQPGHRFDLALDGQRRNVNTTGGSVVLPDVFRGTHTLEVIVIDGSGAELMRSPSRTFFVQQTSIQSPTNANAPPRPTPRPGPR
jgi:hypothetical protein